MYFGFFYFSLVIIIIIRQIIESGISKKKNKNEILIVTSFEQVHRSAGGSPPSQVRGAQLTTDEEMADLPGEDGKGFENRQKAAAEVGRVRFERARERFPAPTWCGRM